MHDGVSKGSCGFDLCTKIIYPNAPPAVPATARYPNVSGSPVDRVTLTQAIPASSATVNIPPLGPASKHTAGDQEQVSDTLLLHVSMPFIYLQPDYCMTLTIHTHSDHSLHLSYKHFEALVVTMLVLLWNILAVLRSPPPTCPINACNYTYLYTCFAVNR